jgi:hypothetical protein
MTQDLRKKICDILEEYNEEKADDQISKAAADVLKNKVLSLFCIKLGLERLTAEMRRHKRRELLAKINPQYETETTAATDTKEGTIRGEFTPETLKKLEEEGRKLNLFSSWMINPNLPLEEATRDDLKLASAAELKSAQGHRRNEKFYEALAKELAPGQKVKDRFSGEELQKLHNKIKDLPIEGLTPMSW